ncbi:MAG: hypothetical protein Q9215_002830 [Flavoplaca cf. flavocitrina]
MIALGVNAFIPPQLGRSDNSRNALDTSAADLLLQDEIEPQTAIVDQPVGHHRGSESISGIVLDSWRSSLLSITTLFQVPRPTFTIIWIFLLYSFTTRVEVLNYQYISLTLGWSLATVNSLLAGNALLSAVILFLLPTIRKIYLQPRRNDQEVDLLIVKGSLLLNAVGMAGFGISIASAFFVLALLVYTSGNGLYDSLTTFGLTSLTGEQRPDDFLVRSGLVQTIAGLPKPEQLRIPTSHDIILASQTTPLVVAIISPTDEIGDAHRQAAYAVYVQDFCLTIDAAYRSGSEKESERWIAKELGPFVGSTSNQADAYLELLLPHRAELLQESLVLARQINGDFPGVPFEELAFEIAASFVGHRLHGEID